MKTDGKEIRQFLAEFGLSAEAVCAEADVSMSTLYKVFRNEHVGPRTTSRIGKAVSRIRERLTPKSKVGA